MNRTEYESLLKEGRMMDALLLFFESVDKTVEASQGRVTRFNLMRDIFGQEHAGKLITYLTSAEKFRELRELAASSKTEGSLRTEYEKVLQTTNVQWKLMMNNINALGIALGTRLLPLVKTFSGIIGGIAGRLEAWFSDDKNKRVADFVVTFGLLVASATALIPVITLVKNSFAVLALLGLRFKGTYGFGGMIAAAMTLASTAMAAFRGEVIHTSEWIMLLTTLAWALAPALKSLMSGNFRAARRQAAIGMG